MLKGPWLQIILTLVTNIPAIIAEVEAANPDLPGAGKKLLVLDEIKTALVESEPVVGEFLSGNKVVMDEFNTAVDVIVSLYNDTAKIVADQQASKLGTTIPAPAAITGTGQIPPTPAAKTDPAASVPHTGAE